MARPLKQPAEKRSETARFRCTLAEKLLIAESAAALNMSEADYLRSRALGYKVKPVTQRTADPALVNEINRIGVNVNQLAVATHRGSDFTRYWKSIGDDINAALSKVLRDGS